jgi:cystathionine beta-lyase family protein involved in aluminum resistance
MLYAGRGHHHEALGEFAAADHLRSRLEGSHALASQVTGLLHIHLVQLLSATGAPYDFVLSRYEVRAACSSGTTGSSSIRPWAGTPLMMVIRPPSP